MSNATLNSTVNSTLDTILNATVLASHCSQNDPFTRANVFGTFLTLQFIQLTQPYGSLLFRGASGFWWRVSPIASLVDGIIIFRQLWLAPSRKQVKRHKWQITAASLLLLRGVVGDEDGSELMTELLKGTFLNAGQGDEEEELSERVSEGVAEGQRQEETPVQLSFEAPALSTTSNIESVPNPMIRRRTSQLEANTPCTEARESRILNAAFGANMLAHSEWRIDLVTWLSVAAIALKLFAVSGAVWFRTACSLLLVGWAAVQTLIILFHRREMGDESKREAVRLAQVLHKELDGRPEMSVYLLLHAPFFGYVGYRMAFELPASKLGVVGKYLCTVPVGLLMLLFLFLSVYAIRMLFRCFVGLFRGKAKECCMALLSCVGSLGLAVLSLSLYMGALITCPVVGESSFPPEVIVSPKRVFSTTYYATAPLWLRIFEGTVLFGYIVYNAVWLLLYFVILVSLFVAILMPANDTPLLSPRKDRRKVSAGTFCFTLVLFILYLMHYDEQDTNKPRWSEFLG
jgi:hypothetical protein